MLLSHDEETIVAQCTPQGSGALALIRISGVDALAVADRVSVLASGKKLSELPTHTIHFGWVVDSTGRKIDQVLFLLTHGPRTFTGQNTVEITSHNNQFICQEIIQVALGAGARLAAPGEFSRRAVLNNKIDVVQAEAINDLIQASTPVALKQSLAQLEGSLSAWLAQLEATLMQAFSLCEASFEFLDDEVSFAQQIHDLLSNVLRDIDTVSKTFDQRTQIRQGIRVALVGSVNVGKSSLFNALLRHERAIVHATPGTTRDTIEAGLYKNGFYLTLVDTAGLRDTHDAIEQCGIERSLQEAVQADVILLVLDDSRMLLPAEKDAYARILTDYQQKVIVVRHKSDLAPVCDFDACGCAAIACSGKTGAGIDLLECALAEKIEHLFKASQMPFALNQRHYDLIRSMAAKIEKIQAMLVDPVPYELVSVHIKDVLQTVADVSGRSLNENMLDAVFKNFCVGK